MKILRLPIDSDLAESSLRMAVDVLVAAGDGATCVHLIVPTGQMFEAKRLLAAIASVEPKTLLGLMARNEMVEVNYAWGEDESRWMLIGRDHIVYSGAT